MGEHRHHDHDDDVADALRPVLHSLDRIETYLKRLDGRITYIQRQVHKMAVDQAAFTAALDAFVADLSAGIAAIQAKIDELELGADFAPLLDTLTAAQATFDAAVVDATDGPPAPPAP